LNNSNIFVITSEIQDLNKLKLGLKQQRTSQYSSILKQIIVHR